MIVVVVWLAALVTAGLILGIVGFGLFGQVGRLRRAVSAAQTDVASRAVDLIAAIPGQTSARQTSAERQGNTAG